MLRSLPQVRPHLPRPVRCVVLAGWVTSAVGGQPEKGQAGRQAMEFHRDRLGCLPVSALQAEPAGQGGAAADEVPFDAVVAVAELA